VTRSLPPAPSLEHLQKEAKRLLRAHRAGEPDAVRRLGAQRTDEVKLADAQLALAREYGFASWPRLRVYVGRMEAHGPGLQHAYREDLDYYDGRAAGLLASAQDGTDAAVATFARWDAPVTLPGARAVIAREHGFPSWAALRRHVADLRNDGEPFARAYRALEAHNVDGLRTLLDRFPELVRAQGTNGNDLLGMATATCDERLVALLLDRGADVAHANVHGWTALHQAAYRGLPLLANLLVGAGAPVDVSARGDGGTPLIVALFWGNRDAAGLLAERGLVPGNLRAAAGLGRLDVVDALVSADGRLARDAGMRRAFYRPHGGFPAWQPRDQPQQVLDEALCWAARNDRADAVDRLAQRGANVDADVYRGTALAWAAAGGRLRALERLVALGADPNRRGTFGGPEHGEGVTALHLAAQNGRVDAIRMLLDAGADPTVRDALYDSTPEGWAAEFGQERARDMLRERGA
jgi:ankyrin repeat protein